MHIWMARRPFNPDKRSSTVVYCSIKSIKSILL